MRSTCSRATFTVALGTLTERSMDGFITGFGSKAGGSGETPRCNPARGQLGTGQAQRSGKSRSRLLVLAQGSASPALPHLPRLLLGAGQAGRRRGNLSGSREVSMALAGLPATVADVIPYRTQEALVQSFVSLYPANFFVSFQFRWSSNPLRLLALAAGYATRSVPGMVA